MTNAEIARAFARLATMLEIDGANPFRVRAYREAGRIVGEQAEPMKGLVSQEGALEALPGIGKDLAQKIRDLVATGTTPLFEEMKAKVPLDVVALTDLQGLGPKRVRTLLDQLGVQNRDDLEQAAKAGKLRDLPGFGEKVEQNVLKALAASAAASGRMLLAGAWPIAHAIADAMRAVPGVEQVEIAGSFRRRKETIGDLDILVCGGAPERVMEAFVKHDGVTEVLGRGETKSSVRMRNGLQVDLRLVPRESFGAALLYFTGSKEHNIELRKIAIEKGLSLNEYSLTRGQRVEAGRTEEDVYKALGLKWIPPELRESRGEIERASFYDLPPLIEESDLAADLHMHTDRTDGRDSLETMVRAAKARGYAYCAVTDHSKALAMVRGFDEARVRKSVEEIAAVRRAVPGIEVLHGLEVDILADGALDLDDDALALLDWVIIALHSRLDQPEPVMTERVLRALDHPAVCAMAHPTGRIIGTRGSAPFDVEKVFGRASASGVALEINAQPDRLDLSDSHARLAHELGVKFVINTDAHSALQLDNIRYGVFVARRAGLGKEAVVNTFRFERFEAWRRHRRRFMTRRAKVPSPVPAPAEPGTAAEPERTPEARTAAKERAAGKKSAPNAQKAAPPRAKRAPSKKR
jgi:DNA polymerase (family 10)